MLERLDDILADAMNVFKLFKDVPSHFQDKAVIDSLEKGKKYLKTKYHLNCTTESIISTHNCAGLVVKALDSQSRVSVFKSTELLQGRLSLSSFQGQ